MSAPAPNVDLDALLDLSEYDSYNSPALSPSSAKPTFASPVTPAVATPSIPSTSAQALSGPSHNYDLYRQQTGFVPGAIANTMAVNQSSNTGYQDFGSLDYLSGLSPDHDVFDFNTSSSQATMDVDFDAADSQHFFNTVNPSTIEQSTPGLASPPVSTSTAGSVGRLWPGAHSQAALAKAQALQRQRQQHQHNHQHQPQPQPQPPQHHQAAQRPGPQQQKPRAKAPHPTDPIVEQKITQLLNSMRAKPSAPGPPNQTVPANLPRAKKDEEDMDEDERLLASEEGKKLSSKERRQLRNKVSARAFRSRRKEYITQLEAEIANKVNENGDLCAQNRALLEENRRLSDLSRMLLSSPAFSSFLETLSANPAAAAPQPPPVKLEPPQQQAREQNQIPKDVNPYGGQYSQQQQIGMAMIPEQTMDLYTLSLDSAANNFQPQVFVVDTPEVPPAVDASLLSGKTSNFVDDTFPSDEDGKVEVSAIQRPAEGLKAPGPADEPPADHEFESDPEFALYRSEPSPSQPERQVVDTDSLSNVDLFGGIETAKMLARYQLVDATEEELGATLSMARVQRLSAAMEPVVSRLELFTLDL